MTSQANMSSGLPPLPSYTLYLQPALLPPIADKYLILILPIVAYWAMSMVFHYIDTLDWFPQYRLHTPAEVLKRNHVSRWEVVRDVIIQQIVQTAVGLGLAFMEPQIYNGKEQYDIARWAQRIRIAQRALPSILGAVGLDSATLAQSLSVSIPSLSGALAGGVNPTVANALSDNAISNFATWEMNLAKVIYWLGVPAVQFFIAVLIVDTWQYFLHRAMHMNKWLYTTFHSRHHRLYVPYAYGALYNHPFEGFLLDTCGAGLAYLVSGMTPRQGMWFFTCSTIKTVDDHCGYALPWDPLQHLTSNNAGYHDVHHQSWGIKTNFSQPFFTIWDQFLGTKWTGGDVSARYERARRAAQAKVDSEGRAITSSASEIRANDSIKPYQDAINSTSTFNNSKPNVSIGKAAVQAIASREQVMTDPSPAGGANILAEESAEEQRETKSLRRSPRKRMTSSTSSGAPAAAGSLKGLRDRVSGGSGGFHGRTGGVLGYESGR